MFFVQRVLLAEEMREEEGDGTAAGRDAMFSFEDVVLLAAARRMREVSKMTAVLPCFLAACNGTSTAVMYPDGAENDTSA